MKVMAVVMVWAVWLPALVLGGEDQPRPAVVGVWELAPDLMGDDPEARKMKEEGVQLVYEFTPEGRAYYSVTSQGMTLTLTGSYQLLDESTMRLELDAKGDRPKSSQIVNFRIRGDRMEMLNARGKLMIFTRGDERP